MSKQRISTIAAAGLLLAMAPAWAQTANGTGWRTYRSADYGFHIDYPRTMTFYPGGAVRPPEKSMFPICDDETVTCFEYNGHALDETQIQAIGLSVNLLRDITTEADCGNMETDSKPIQIRILHGVRFYYGETGDAGLGSGRGVSAYRTFHKGSCFEVALVTAQSNVSAQDLKEEGLAPANPHTLRRLYTVMEKMLDSFAFSGPVEDGAGWSHYTGSRCGEEFAYPDNTSVENVAPTAPNLFNAWGLSCVERFRYRGRQYTVAAKENLPSREAMNAWLESSGFPRLDESSAQQTGDLLIDYHNPDIVYIVHGSSIFLITATDEAAERYGNPVGMDCDGVVAHLVRSFRVR
jgi:hypothetical protein